MLCFSCDVMEEANISWRIIVKVNASSARTSSAGNSSHRWRAFFNSTCSLCGSNEAQSLGSDVAAGNRRQDLLRAEEAIISRRRACLR
jgi:hypothetical protein